MQNNNGVFVTEVQEFFNQRMSTVETSIKDSPSDIKSGFIEIQKTLLNYDDRIKELELNRGQREQNCEQITELENKLERDTTKPR